MGGSQNNIGDKGQTGQNQGHLKVIGGQGSCKNTCIYVLLSPTIISDGHRKEWNVIYPSEGKKGNGNISKRDKFFRPAYQGAISLL